MPFFLLLKRYAPIIKYGMIIGVVCALCYGIWDYSQTVEQQKIVKLENEKLANQIELYQKQIKEQNDKIMILRDTNIMIEKNYNIIKKELNELSKLSKEEIKENKPKIELDINKMFNDIQSNMACSTGDKDQCSK